MKTIFNTPIKKVFTVNVGTMTKEQAEKTIKELMRSYNEDINPSWLIEYERKLLIESRIKKLENLNSL
jgi:polyhydroxyalkanoate synthesis regulator phasin